MLEGANWSRLKEPCHTTSVTRMASNRTPEPNATRLRISPVRIIGGGSRKWGWRCYPLCPLPARSRMRLLETESESCLAGEELRDYDAGSSDEPFWFPEGRRPDIVIVI